MTTTPTDVSATIAELRRRVSLLGPMPEQMISFMDGIKPILNTVADILASQAKALSEAETTCLRLCTHHSFATGHGDTVSDIITEIDGQITARALAAEARFAEVETPTSEMLLAGARSIGNSMGAPNFMVRAKACWDAMQAARNGVAEPRPNGAFNAQEKS